MKNLIIAYLLISAQFCFGQTDSSAIYFKHGMEEKDSGLFQIAIRNFEKASNYDPHNADAYLQLALTNLEMRRTDKAILFLTEANKIRPGNKFVIQQLMKLYFDYRQFSKAIELAETCKTCDGASRILGMSYYNQEEYVVATGYLQAHLSINPTDAEAQYTLARAYLDMEEYQKSLPYFEIAVMQKGARPTWNYELGLLYFTLEEYKKAVINFDKAKRDGYVAGNDFYENLGFACLYSGDYTRGEEYLINIWKRKPANTDIFREIAEIFYKQKQFDKSLEYCQKLLEKDPKDAKALYQAGLVFLKRGEKDRGQQMCDAAIVMDPALENLRRKKEIPGM